MNRALFFGIATFFAVVGISLVGADKKASAGLFHRGCGCACCRLWRWLWWLWLCCS